MTIIPPSTGVLQLEHVLAAAGLDPDDVIVIRHVYRDHEKGLNGPEDLADLKRLKAYTGDQRVDGRAFPLKPPRYWLVCIGEGRNARLLTVYEHRGERRRYMSKNGTERRVFNLRETTLLTTYRGRLTFTWSNHRRWVFYGATAAEAQVVSLVDPQAVPFPGFDSVLITHASLREVVSNSSYSAWQHALSSVQGIYLIADTSTGHFYVGMTSNRHGILGRWSDYARTGTGGNKALRELVGKDAAHAEKFVYSILRVFGLNASTDEIGRAEEHYKQALLSRMHGNNRN